MATTKIEWADRVWNPVTGCTRVSEGCRNCYAERMSKRLAGRFGYPAENPFSVTMHPDRLKEPLGWRKPQRIFVCSMGDLFHEDVPVNYIDKILRTIQRAPHHTYLLLSKRPENFAEYLHNALNFLPNVHLGVSVEDQATANERIPLLLQTPAAKRFVSIEPMLGPVDLQRWLPARWQCSGCGYRTNKSVGCCNGYCQDSTGASCDAVPCPSCGRHHYWSGSMASLKGVILGGESGPGARPMHPDWARKVRDDCKAAHVPFFFKQWGENGARARSITTGEPVFPMFKNYQHWVNKGATWVNGGTCIDRAGKILRNGKDFMEAVYPVAVTHRVGKRAAGSLLDGVEFNEVAE